MRRLILAASFLPLISLPILSRQQQAPHVVETDPLSPEKERQQFLLPPGFEAQLVAAEPDIHKPMNLAFDDQGRLWVTDTVEYPFPAKPGARTRDTVKVLSDFGPDGKARQVTTFADNLNIPIGVLPLPGPSPREALVYSIPNIWRLQDSLGKGVADQRSIAYGTYEFRDTHGMTNNFLYGLDGWVYACHGYANTSTIKGADGRAITMNSGNTYRLRPDGSRLEQFTWGQVNPFGLTVDPRGYLYTSDCHSEPIYQLIRGGYYPSFGKPHDGLGFAPTMFTGYKGSTAVAGIAYYDADMFPAAYRNSAFVGDVMTNQVVEFKITWKGASPSATQHVLLDSKDRWFRPVDVKLGPDGALYVADFYNCIIGHYEVPLLHPKRDRERGRIWRIVYKGADARPTPARADWTKANVKEVVRDLGHPNIAVRYTAAHELVRRGSEVAGEVRGSGRPEALYVLDRLGQLDEAILTQAAADRSEVLRIHARRILANRPRWVERERGLALTGLKDDSPHVQRASAEALGLHNAPANLAPLLELRHRVPKDDTHLLHAVRVAMRNQLRAPEVWKSVTEPKDKAAVADVALGVPTREAAAFLLDHLTKAAALPSDAAALTQHVARHGDAAMRKDLVRFCREQHGKDAVRQANLFRAVERGVQEAAAPLPDDARAWGPTWRGA
ncbi:MAG: PVC-type heme-binding CxxCH protein [Gemmataceae bacterium]